MYIACKNPKITYDFQAHISLKLLNTGARVKISYKFKDYSEIKKNY